MAHPPHKIGVLPDRNRKAATSLDDPLPSMQIMPVSELFEELFDTDAHFTCYTPIGMEVGAGWPRLGKPVLSRIREAGGDLGMVMLALDYDRPGHAEWTDPQQVDDFLRDFKSVSSKVGDFAHDWAYFYTTRNGARIVYLLDKPLSPEQYESKHHWLCQQFNKHGLEIDLAVSDWTRLFRAPLVVRNSEPSWEHPCFRMEHRPRTTLKGTFLGDSDRGLGKSKYAPILPIDGDKPEADAAINLLHAPDANPNGYRAMSDWHKQVKKRLRGRECFPVLFEGRLLASEGSRDDTLLTMVGQVCSLVSNIEGTTPEHIYALFLEPVLRLEPDSGTPDWTESLWDKVQRMWALEDAKIRQHAHEEKKKAEERASIAETVVDGMRSWCDDELLHSADPEIRLEAAQQRFLANCQSTYYPINASGRYDGIPLKEHQIVPYIRSRGLESIIPTRIVSQQGGVRDISPTTIANQYSWPVTEVVGYPQLTEGGFIDSEGRLRLSLYERNDGLVPTFNREVDAWLQKLFGKRYEIACKWIGYALAFEDGCICAMSIHGQPGVGKKLLVRGLAECLKNPAHADAADLVGDWQYGLRESPFVWVDEGWPNGKHHPLDTLRNLTGGDPLRLNMKMMAPIKAFNPARVIMTANNMDLVMRLLSGRDVTQEDTDALKDRLLHFDVGGDAAEHLARLGGVRHTAGWIQADGGGASKYTLARHFLWLYQNRQQFGEPDKGGRFLVKGEGNEAVMAEIRTSAGDAQIVVETLISLMNTEFAKGEKSRAGIVTVDDKLFVTTKAVVEHYRNAIKKSAGGRLDAKGISAVLKNISESEKTVAAVFKDHIGMVEWHQIDPYMLYLAAKRDGWACPYLQKILHARQQEEKELQS